MTQGKPNHNLFNSLVADIPTIGKAWHSNDLLVNAQNNQQHASLSFKNLTTLSADKKQSAIIISAGPSVHRFNVVNTIKSAHYSGTIIAVDGSLIKCLKNNVVPDYVITLDPHPTRMVRWFGDDDFEENTRNDDYFSRQDLDIDFRNNSIKENDENIALINKYAPQIKLIICSSSPKNVVKRAQEAGFQMYWWNPIVDDPKQESSLTREIYNINKLSCMNTGGTVGTAAWVFANAILKINRIALTGMDLGYHMDTPVEKTQSFYELQEFVNNEEEFSSLFPRFVFPLSGETFYTDPTYFWYRKNFLQLLEQGSGKTYNCTEAGTLFDDNLPCITLNEFLT